MQARTYVAINDPVHKLIRSITRVTPLVPSPLAGGRLSFEYRIKEGDLPEAYYTLARFHTLEGMPLESFQLDRWRIQARFKAVLPQQVNYFDVLKLDRRCSRDLRLGLSKRGPGMLAAELLSFGTGTLRARNDDALDRVHRYLWSQHGRLWSEHETVCARIWALHWNSLPMRYNKQKESFDSTNVIYGDAFGEVEQLWDRRADTNFLEQVARSLQPMSRKSEVAGFLHPPLNLETVMKFHLRNQAVWKTPPSSARNLLRRIEYILQNTVVDDAPQTLFRYRSAIA